MIPIRFGLFFSWYEKLSQCYQPPQSLNAAEQMKNNSCYRIPVLKSARNLKMPYNHSSSFLVRKHWWLQRHNSSQHSMWKSVQHHLQTQGPQTEASALAGAGKLSHIKINFHWFILPRSLPHIWQVFRYCLTAFQKIYLTPFLRFHLLEKLSSCFPIPNAPSREYKWCQGPRTKGGGNALHVSF